jgi:phage protein D
LNLPTTTYKILYNNKDITSDISDHLKSLTYTDKVSGEADELELELEDKDNLWVNDWYPDKNATLYAEIISNGNVLKCGNFQIDEPAFSFSKSDGDSAVIKGVSAYYSQALRTKRHSAHENKTLGEIARTVAARHSLTVQGVIPDITIGRVTQNHKNDLAFLESLANTYGYIFSVKGNIMVFTDITTLEKGTSVLTLKKTDVTDCGISDKSWQVYKNANVKYHNSATKEDVEYDSDDDEDVSSEDTLAIRTKAENKQQAERIAATNLYRNNSFQKEGEVTVKGNTLLVSGVNFQLIGCGKISALYHVLESTHTLSRSDDYVTSLKIKQVGEVSAGLYKL